MFSYLCRSAPIDFGAMSLEMALPVTEGFMVSSAEKEPYSSVRFGAEIRVIGRWIGVSRQSLSPTSSVTVD